MKFFEKKTLTFDEFKTLYQAGRVQRRNGRWVVDGKGRSMFADAAFTFRMGVGFPGDITRVEAATVEACLIDVNAPPTAYGQAVVIDPTTQGVRPIVAGDSGLTAIYGITVRPFPTQQQSATNFGAVTLAGTLVPPTSGVIDVLRSGYILTALNAPTTVPVKGGAVDVWFAATSGAHIQGGFEAAHTGGSSFTIAGSTTTQFQGGVDANGVAEIAFNI